MARTNTTIVNVNGAPMVSESGASLSSFEVRDIFIINLILTQTLFASLQHGCFIELDKSHGCAANIEL